MHPELIKAHLVMKGSSIKEIGKSVGVSGTCVSHVVHGRGVSAPVAHRISEVIDIPLATLWPGKYLKPARARYKFS